MNSLNTRIEIWKRFLNVNEVKVTPEQSVKLLGTEMDYEQNFERHFSFLCVKQVIIRNLYSLPIVTYLPLEVSEEKRMSAVHSEPGMKQGHPAASVPN